MICLSITWLVTSGQTLETSTGMRIARGKITKESHPLKREMAVVWRNQAEEFNGQFTDVFIKSRFNEAPLLDRSAPRMNDISVSTDGPGY